jgi:hypothetical protein
MPQRRLSEEDVVGADRVGGGEGESVVDDPARLADVHALGVDEHAWQRANAYRHTQFATGIVDLSPGRPARLLDVVADRSGDAYGTWLHARDPVASPDYGLWERGGGALR